MSSMGLPGMGGDFAKGVSGSGAVYDTSPTGLGLSPAYLANTSASASSTGGGGSTSGIISAFAGSAAPDGWVLCDGSTYDGTTVTYAALYAVIGITYGGAGIASFKVPDLRGRVITGFGTNAAVSALGNSDGVAVANRRPQHRHTPHTHTLSGTGFIPAPVAGTSYDAAAPTGGTGGINSTDGGSGTATDALDAPAYLVLNYLIAL